MKLQKIYINGKYEHIINYDSTSQDESFVIDICPDIDEYVELIRFPEDEMRVLNTENGDPQYKLSKNDLRLIFDGNNGNEGDIEIIATKGGKKGGYSLESNCLRYTLKEEDKREPQCHEISFKLSDKEKKITIYVAPEEYIRDVVIDFGSEATQMAITSRSRSEKKKLDNICNIFSTIKTKLKGSEDDINYYQFDEDKRLFKSRFLIRKEIEHGDLKAYTENVEETLNSDSVQKVLYSKSFYNDKKGDYIVAPNIKLLTFGGEDFPKVTINKGNEKEPKPIDNIGNDDNGDGRYLLYRRSVSLFVIDALGRICSEGDNKKLVSFQILMPNVYSHVESIKIVRSLYKDIKTIIKKAGREDVIKGFQVTAVSESDASIMGVCNYLRKRPQDSKDLAVGNYLLFDAGKGTLDFSLVKLEYIDGKGYKYRNIWRSGIIGAGNSLTFAYLLALVHKSLESFGAKNLSDGDLRSYLYNKCLSDKADKAVVNDLIDAVEKFKRGDYGSGNDNNAAGDNDVNINLIDLSNVNEWIKKANSNALGDKKKEYVDPMIDALVEEVIREITQLEKGCMHKHEVSGVIFAGRAFELKEFKDVLWKSLKDYYKKEDLKEVEFIDADHDATTMKNVCLFCVDSLIDGNYSRDSYVEEQEKKDKETRNSLSWKQRIKNITNLPSLMQKVKNFFMSIPNWLKKMIQNLFGGEDNGLGESESVDVVNLSADNLFHVKNARTFRLQIGGRIYRSDELETGKKYSVFFTESGYVARKESADGKLIRLVDDTINMKRSEFTQSSLFPNIVLKKENDLKLVPEKPKRQNNEPPVESQQIENDSSDEAKQNKNEKKPAEDSFSDIQKEGKKFGIEQPDPEDEFQETVK